MIRFMTLVVVFQLSAALASETPGRKSPPKVKELKARASALGKKVKSWSGSLSHLKTACEEAASDRQSVSWRGALQSANEGIAKFKGAQEEVERIEGTCSSTEELHEKIARSVSEAQQASDDMRAKLAVAATAAKGCKSHENARSARDNAQAASEIPARVSELYKKAHEVSGEIVTRIHEAARAREPIKAAPAWINLIEASLATARKASAKQEESKRRADALEAKYTREREELKKTLLGLEDDFVGASGVDAEALLKDTGNTLEQAYDCRSEVRAELHEESRKVVERIDAVLIEARSLRTALQGRPKCKALVTAPEPMAALLKLSKATAAQLPTTKPLLAAAERCDAHASFYEEIEANRAVEESARNQEARMREQEKADAARADSGPGLREQERQRQLAAEAERRKEEANQKLNARPVKGVPPKTKPPRFKLESSGESQ